RELGLLVLAGLLWFGVYQVLLNEAERRVDAGTASMLVLIAPIFIVALAAVFLKERTTPNLLLGGALAFAGVVVIGLATSSRSASLVGVILCLVAALASAIDRKSTRLNSSHVSISYAVFCLKKKKIIME